MTDKSSKRNDGIGSNEGVLASGRRSILQGAAALGIGGSAVGAAMAQGGDESDDGASGGDGEESESEADDEDSNDAGSEESQGTPVAVQLYTLRNLPDTTLDLIRRVGGVDNNGGPGYAAVETAGLGEASTEEINEAFEQTGLVAAAAHVGLDELRGDSFEQTVETYKSIGVDTFVVPYISPDSIDTVEKVENLAQQMNEVSARLQERDARLGFHNHDGEFQQIGDGTHPLQVFDETLDQNVIFELDVGWILTADYDPVEIIRQYSDRTELVHMKDMAEGEFYEIGEGNVDMVEVSKVARNEADVDYLIYEHDEPADPAGSVATGAGVLSFIDGEPGLKCLKFEDVGGPDYSGELEGLDDVC